MYAIYSRKSKFTGKGESIENQIELCRQYIYDLQKKNEAYEVNHDKTNYANTKYNAKEENMNILNGDIVNNKNKGYKNNILIYEDEGFSGGNIQRPQFKKMMEDARKKNFSTIICYRLDRISRNIGDFAKLIEELNTLGISFISIKEQFDTSSPLGRAMMYIASVFSQLERETIAERIRDNMYELAKTGRWLGGITPTGYKSEAAQTVTVDNKTKKSYMLKIIDNEAKIIKLIYDKFLNFNSLTKVETELIQNGIKSKNKKYFSRFTIKAILENPVYMKADEDAYHYFMNKGVELFSPMDEFDGEKGIMAYNKTIQKPNRTNSARNIKEWIVAVGKHEGIVRGADWAKVQERLACNKNKSYRKVRSNTALLSGLLRCKKCCSYMRPKLTGRINSRGEHVYNYLCEMKEKSRGCVCNICNINGNKLDELVFREIMKIPVDDKELNKAISDMGRKSTIFNCESENEGELYLLNKALEENKREITNLIDFIAGTESKYPNKEHIGNNKNNKIHDWEFSKKINEKINILYKKENDIKERIKMIASESETVCDGKEANDIDGYFLSFEKLFENLNVETKRDIIKTFIDKVLWDGENTHVYFHQNPD